MPQDITQSDVPPGSPAHCRLQCMAALQANSRIVELVGRENIVDGHTADDVGPVTLAVESVSGGSDQSGVVEHQRHTIQVTPFLSPEKYREFDNSWLEVVRDRALDVLKDGIGPGFIPRGATDGQSFDEPQTADDVDALMQHTGRYQFVVNITPSDGVSG